MKIVYISNSIIPSRTANSIHVMKMCQAFADNGHEVVLLAPDDKLRYESNVNNIFEYYGVKENFTIKKLWYPNSKGKSLIYSMGIFIYLLLNKSFDLSYGRFVNGCYISSILGIKTMFESHVPIWNRKFLDKYFFARLIKSKYFLYLIVISNVLKEEYIKNTTLTDTDIIVAHDGADEVQDFNKKFKLNGKKIALKIGYIGSLYNGKGMEIISKLSYCKLDNVEFHIVGGSEEELSLWRHQCFSDNTFFYGFIPQGSTFTFVNAFDICILPNQKKVQILNSLTKDNEIGEYTSPLKLFQYMSHKKAIIASDIKVLKEVLNSDNSIICSVNDIEQWIDAIDILKNEQVRTTLGTKAYEDFKSHYTWKIRAKNVIEKIV